MSRTDLPVVSRSTKTGAVFIMYLIRYFLDQPSFVGKPFREARSSSFLYVIRTSEGSDMRTPSPSWASSFETTSSLIPKGLAAHAPWPGPSWRVPKKVCLAPIVVSLSFSLRAGAGTFCCRTRASASLSKKAKLAHALAVRISSCILLMKSFAARILLSKSMTAKGYGETAWTR